MNIAGVLCINAANHGDRIAIRFRDRSISYREALGRVQSIAAQLEKTGLEAGQRVGLSMGDHPDHLLAHFAVAWLGAVIVPIDHRWTPAEKSRAATAFETALVITDGANIDSVKTLSLDVGQDDVPAPPLDSGAGDLLVSLSSGTTGRPKGAVVTHDNLYERFVSQWVAIGYDARDCFAIVTPLFFGAGRSFGMSLLVAGGSVQLSPPPMKPPELLHALRSPGVTAAFLPPTLLRRLLPLYDGSTLLPDLNYLIVSGEPLYAEEAATCLEKVSPNLFSYYASSEGGGISVLRPDQIRDHAETVGIPTFRTEVDIAAGDASSLPDGETGRLRYRGPGVATRFLDEDGSEREAEPGSWFYPGDLAVRLPGGYVALRGRDKDVIIRGGVNIYPAEIEQVLLGHPSVREAVVIGVAHAERGEKVVAFLCGDEIPDASTLSAFCEQSLARYKVPEAFQVLDELPRRSSGKLDRQALVKFYGDIAHRG
jgi:acyl-CoA synthetase (AMP-forming)/AMP-acid ligase II